VYRATNDRACIGRISFTYKKRPSARINSSEPGFRDELTLVSSNGSEVLGISLWEQKQDAEAYNRATYPDVQRILSKVIEGTPQVQTYEVSMSTIHKTAAHHG